MTAIFNQQRTYPVKVEQKKLPENQVEITVRVSREDAQPALNRAAAHLSEHNPIKGFRPGKAPYEVVARALGEGTILQEALEDIINDSFNKILEQENLLTYGKVNFDLLPIAEPTEMAAYKATVTLMPNVTLGDWQTKKIKRNEIKVTDEEVTSALNELAEMTAAEEQTVRQAKIGDKAVVDFEVMVDGKVIEGGTAKDFALTLGEGRMIPGFEEKVVGAKAGDKLEFELSFPKDYQATHLSGKPAQFKINVNQVIERIKPAIDDAFAMRVGMKDLTELKAKLTENLKKEKLNKEDEVAEIAAIKQLAETSKFDDIPKVMIEESIDELVHDFEHSLAHQGVKLDQYLETTKKKIEDIRKEFEPKALNRVKSSMALGKLAEQEKLTVSTDEINQELKNQEQAYANNPERLNDIKQPEYRRHVGNTLINRKLIDYLKSKIVE